MERGDFGASLDSEYIADDFEWILADVPGTLGTYRGRDAFLEFMRTWTEDFENWSVEVDRLIDASDDRVVGVFHQRATGKGSGVPVELPARHGLRAGGWTRDSDAQLRRPD